MSNKQVAPGQVEKKHKVVYGVTVTLGDKTEFKVVAADNRHQAISQVASGIITARPMTPFELLSYQEEQQKKREAEARAKAAELLADKDPAEMAVGGLPAGDRL